MGPLCLILHYLTGCSFCCCFLVSNVPFHLSSLSTLNKKRRYNLVVSNKKYNFTPETNKATFLWGNQQS